MEISYVFSPLFCIMRLLLFLFYLILLFMPSVIRAVKLSDRSHPRLSNVSDQQALLGFRSAITSYSPSQPLPTNVSVCEWTGVICSRRRQRVVSICLKYMGFEGTISPLLGNLSFLKILDLSYNSFHGYIPYQLGSLFRLKMLLLSHNKLEGSIPPTLGGCRSLINFSMSFNHVEGNIPPELCGLPNLHIIELGFNNLAGAIPACLGNISSLEEIRLNDNKLDGRVPFELGMLSLLRNINATNNSLTGQIPSSFSNCTNLRGLYLGYNHVGGNIPPELCVLPNLEIISLGSNSLTGTIPSCLGNMSSLESIYLYKNNLHGRVPFELGMLSLLRIIHVSNNRLTGQIPSSLSNCTNLGQLTLCHNQLTGHIPWELCAKRTPSLDFIASRRNNLHGPAPSISGMPSLLSVLDVWNNSLTGQIPSSFSNCINLQTLGLGDNLLTGRIPANLCSKNTWLTGLYLFSNQLSGSIPPSLFNCTNLRMVEFGTNQLSGVVAMELGKLTQLQSLNLENNQLVSGSTTTLPILTALSNCSSLRRIVLSRNRLTGRLPFSIDQLSANLKGMHLNDNELVGGIPPQIGNLTSLTFLELQENYFAGAIPSSLKRLQRLERLYVGFNNLEGNIPPEIGQLKSLGALNLGGNNLSGRIPESLAHLKQLIYLELNQNQLSGNIPASIGKCVKLLRLDLSYNRLRGHIPPEIGGLANLAFYFNLSNNLLQGPVPLELSKMIMVQAIDISANWLTGDIPSVLGSCEALEYLNLSSNILEGFIPASLSELQNLNVMDFSSNNLSGEIPMSLEKLKMLSHLNFSFNKLSGAVPKDGVFKRLGATAFMGNVALCGSWVNLPPCSASEHKSHLHLERVIISVVATTTIVVWCLLLGILWKRNHRRLAAAGLLAAAGSLKVGHQRISYTELITATDEFSDSNLLGVGSFGKVYKGIMNDGTIIAVKLLNLENEAANKSFERECKVLSRVKHRNLIKIITSYSDLDSKALIFPFMPNGSLEKWLYPNGEENSCALSLIQRLNIAIDIAHGMAYLHHHCFMQVIHCDLKPNNVLLGEDLTAYLIDFGIATICFPNPEESAFTSTHALKGSTGYIPPEYGLRGQVTTKGDVYSYGIVLLEMLTRKKPTHSLFVEGMDLKKWVSSGFPNGLKEVVDSSLLKSANTSNTEENKKLICLSQLIRMGLLCTQQSPKDRPNMMDIVSTLEGIRDTFLEATNFNQISYESLLGSTNTSSSNAGSTSGNNAGSSQSLTF